MISHKKDVVVPEKLKDDDDDDNGRVKFPTNFV